MTTRILAGTLALVPLLGACAPPAATPPSPPPAAAAQEVMETPRMCVIQDGALRMIPIRVTSGGRDTLTADGQPLSAVTRASDYAAGTEWYQRKEPILFRGLQHVQYGLPRTFAATDLVRVGEYRGVGIYAEPGYTFANTFVYIPDRPGCSFQPYEPPHRPE